MGCCQSRLNANMVLPHELRVGDHILIKNCCGSVNALFIDDDKNRCVYIDDYPGYVTETYLSTLCSDRDKLYRYDYSTITTMSAKQTVLNAKYFVARGKFSKSCLFSGYQFVYNLKVNKYTSSNYKNDPKNDQKSDQDQQQSLLVEMMPNALSLCIDNHGEDHIDIETSSESNESKTDTNSAGAMDKTLKKAFKNSKSSKSSLEMQVGRIYDSQNTLLKKLKLMDAEIRKIKKTVFDQEGNKEQQTGSISLKSVNDKNANTPPLNSGKKKKKHGSLSTSPITMDTSMTLTPIKSETGNRGGHTVSKYGRNLGIIVAPDINDVNTSSSVGGQFSVVDTSMSMSTTKC